MFMKCFGGVGLSTMTRNNRIHFGTDADLDPG